MEHKVAIIDYGMGNLRSVQNAITRVGGDSVFIKDPKELINFNKIILPGVGAFAQAIQALNQTGLTASLNERREAGAHILGICLGMQLMCRVSEEDGTHAGLNWFSSQVKKFSTDGGLSVPHMGWNGVDFACDDIILNGLSSGGDAYFVHSYYVQCDDAKNVLATTAYGREFHSIIRNGNVCGIQFHPEKSQEFGLQVFQNFVGIAC